MQCMTAIIDAVKKSKKTIIIWNYDLYNNWDMRNANETFYPRVL